MDIELKQKMEDEKSKNSQISKVSKVSKVSKNSKKTLNSNEYNFFLEEINQQNNLEKNLAYSNTIGIISKFFVLLNLSDTEIFENDSMLLNSIMRLMRKNMQVLSKDDVKIVGYENSFLNLKQFFKTFKVKI